MSNARQVSAVVAAVVTALTLRIQARAADDPLARARQLYNQQQFEGAINAAEEARRLPARADAADLVAARAYLERFRGSAASDDLTNARERLRRIDPRHFVGQERIEYLIGLGEALYFDGEFGAAADVFQSALRSGDLPSGDARERVVDWWAMAVDRDAKPRLEMDRQAIYQRLRSRLDDELGSHPSSGAAAYWLAAAARAQGDLQGAWEAAEAAWVRAPFNMDRGAALRADIDRLVQQVIVPERARIVDQPPELLRQQWEQFKARWSK